MKCGSLTDSQFSELKSLLLSYIDVFSKTPNDFGRTNLVKHKINTTSDSPIRKRAYRTSPHMRSVIQSQVEDMLAQDIIEVSHSPWAAPVVMVRKKDGNWHFCIDYRALNSVTVKDAHHLPRTDDTLDALGGSAVFSTMDLSSGYWQVQLDEQDQEKNGVYYWPLSLSLQSHANGISKFTPNISTSYAACTTGTVLENMLSVP